MGEVFGDAAADVDDADIFGFCAYADELVEFFDAVNVHIVAFEPKAFPVTETTAPKTPFAGVTARVGTTVNEAVRIVGSPGFPVTVTV